MSTSTKLIIPAPLSNDMLEKVLNIALKESTKGQIGQIDMSRIRPNSSDPDFEYGHVVMDVRVGENGETFKTRGMFAFVIKEDPNRDRDFYEIYSGPRTILSLGDDEQGIEIMNKVYDATGGFFIKHDYNEEVSEHKPLNPEIFGVEPIRESMNDTIMGKMEAAAKRIYAEAGMTSDQVMNNGLIHAIRDHVEEDVDNYIEQLERRMQAKTPALKSPTLGN